ncbi:hypothetical protein BO82DRAFT_16355 [Aspergillus uvarum CBS 121591]|uniref:Uncharacterized protein n=1 Tax=Aspergillus uvarum CBS 121591 TaxID=1448315 RepID=A0A319DZN8_9EURO|nr:hypothetical protein BO82DRAFT_16355 [Aspergillus uvarum CBS 121591]PYH84332.1 hypothetical protein BO82DRAFT_16355 [Aspergillus uvarum CBS 121591]
MLPTHTRLPTGYVSGFPFGVSPLGSRLVIYLRLGRSVGQPYSNCLVPTPPRFLLPGLIPRLTSIIISQLSVLCGLMTACFATRNFPL